MHDSQRIAQANAASAKKAHNSVGHHIAQTKKNIKKAKFAGELAGVAAKSYVNGFKKGFTDTVKANKKIRDANKKGKAMTNYYGQYSDAATKKAAAVKSQRDENRAAYIDKMISYGYSRKEAEKRWKNKKNK
jgi:hypothetical protein